MSVGSVAMCQPAVSLSLFVRYGHGAHAPPSARQCHSHSVSILRGHGCNATQPTSAIVTGSTTEYFRSSQQKCRPYSSFLLFCVFLLFANPSLPTEHASVTVRFLLGSFRTSPILSRFREGEPIPFSETPGLQGTPPDLYFRSP